MARQRSQSELAHEYCRKISAAAFEGYSSGLKSDISFILNILLMGIIICNLFKFVILAKVPELPNIC